MKLFKMLGQVFEENPSTIVVKEKKLSDLVSEYNTQFIRSQEEARKNLKQENTVIKNQANINDNSKANYSQKNKQYTNSQGNSNTLYVLFAPSGDTLSVLKNNNKEDIKLYGISHLDKNNSKAKQACKYINDLVLKKKVFFEQIKVNNNTEYKIFLDKEKTASLNELLIQNNLSFSGKSKEDYLIENKNEEQAKAYETKPLEKTKKQIKGIFVKSLTAPYLFDDTNKSSYVVVLNNAGKEENYWGIDLQRVILEKKIQKGDNITLENIGPELVTIDVAIKEKGKVVRYESKQVKRNTWTAEILEKLTNNSEIKDELTSDSKKLSENKSELYNCYALFSISANSFVCMHNNKKEEYQLFGINEDIISVQQNKEIKKHLNEIISKRVVYIKINNKEDGLVTLYLNKDDKISVNENLINHHKLNEPQVENAIVQNTIIPVKEKVNDPSPVQTVKPVKEVVQEPPIFDDIPQEENLADYGYSDNDFPEFNNTTPLSDIEPPDDFFAGFDIPSEPVIEDVKIIDNISKEKIATEKDANDFFADFDLEDSSIDKENPPINITSQKIVTDINDIEMPDNFFEGIHVPTEEHIEKLSTLDNNVRDISIPEPDDFFAGFDLEESSKQLQTSTKELSKVVIATNDINVESLSNNESNLSINEESIQPIKKKLAFGRKK